MPTMDEWGVFPGEAVAVGLKATEQGIARVEQTRQDLIELSEASTRRSREMTTCLMEKGFIKPPPE